MASCIEPKCLNQAEPSFALCKECANKVYTNLGEQIGRVLQGDNKKDNKKGKE